MYCPSLRKSRAARLRANDLRSRFVCTRHQSHALVRRVTGARPAARCGRLRWERSPCGSLWAASLGAFAWGSLGWSQGAKRPPPAPALPGSEATAPSASAPRNQSDRPQRQRPQGAKRPLHASNPQLSGSVYSGASSSGALAPVIEATMRSTWTWLVSMNSFTPSSWVPALAVPAT